MAKDKSLGSNPVQAYHKKAKQAVINKSRSDRIKHRDVQLQKRQPEQVQRQIDELLHLQKAGKITSHDTQLLNSLVRDLARITKLRAENRNQPLITSERLQRKDQKSIQKTKIPKDPTKSFYYDPIYNPFGVPPPGMEYKEADPSDLDSDSSTTSSTALIPMPAGPPPSKSREAYMSTREVKVRSRERVHHSLRESSVPREPFQQNPGLEHSVHSNDGPVQVCYAAAPVMRDLRQESTAFVPKTLKRKPHFPCRASSTSDPMTRHLPGSSNDATASSVVTGENSSDLPSKRRLNLAPSITYNSD